MSKQNISELVKEIIRMAKPYSSNISTLNVNYLHQSNLNDPISDNTTDDTTDDTTDTAPSQKVAPKINNSGNSLASVPIIKTMQEQLIALAKDVISEINVAPMGGTGREAGEASGRNSFADFITQHYLANSPVKGIEYDPDPSKVKMDQKKPTGPSVMNNVMDTMMRVGSESNEFLPDGKWGPKTNAALHNSYALAFSLLTLSKDLNIKVQYTDAELADLQTKIPEAYTDISIIQKINFASDITKQIKGIIDMYDQIKVSFLQNPTYQAYIEGDKSINTYKNQNAVLTKDNIANLQNQFDKNLKVSFQNQDQKWVSEPITVNDLLTTQSLQAWQQAHAPNTPLKNIINSLRNAVGMMSGNTEVGSNGQVRS